VSPVVVWFFDPATNTLRYTNVELDSPMFRALRDVSRPVSPRLWFATILGALQRLGVHVPEPGEEAEDLDHAALVFWNDEGEGILFPLFREPAQDVDLAALGMALHQLAQLLTDWPSLWETIPSGDDDEDDEVGMVWA